MGVSFILSNQDVSSSPLGKVHTIADFVTELVSTYNTAIGSTAYGSAIGTMATKLLKNGLYGKLFAIYPILGSTLAKQVVNLKSPGTLDMFVAANASAGSDGKHIVFNNQIGVGEQQPPFIDDSKGKLSTYMVVKKDSVYNGAKFLQITEGKTWSSIGSYVGCGSSGGAIRIVTLPTMTVDGGIKTKIQRFAFTYDGEEDKVYCSLNGGTSVSASGNSRQTLTLNTGFGAHWYNARTTTSGASQDGNTEEFGGDLWFYALGKLSIEESIIMDGIVAGFLSSVKGI